MVYTEVPMKIEITEEFVAAITRSVREWKRETVPHESEDQHYDVYCEREYGMKVEFAATGNIVSILGATMVDEEKYINFLLKFGDMPNE
jgi:hypothetical protein